LDRRHGDGCSWSAGNDVEPLIHGSAYFPELLRGVQAMRAGDLLLFTDWRGDPDQLLAGPGTEVSRTLCEAAVRGVVVKGLIWRSHLTGSRSASSKTVIWARTSRQPAASACVI
jgi:hypothetical protein